MCPVSSDGISVELGVVDNVLGQQPKHPAIGAKLVRHGLGDAAKQLDRKVARRLPLLPRLPQYGRLFFEGVRLSQSGGYRVQ
jgi:hypothetical protein